MKYIISVLKYVVSYLENEYEPNETIYKEFNQQYQKVKDYLQKIQFLSEKIQEYNLFFDEVTEKNKLFDKNKSERQNKLSESCLVLNESIKNVKDKIESIRARLVDFNRQILELGYEKNGINQCVEALKLQKPCLFSSKKIKVEFREKKKKYSDQLQAVIGKEIKIKNQISEIEGLEKKLQIEISKNESKLKQEQETYNKWVQEEEAKIYQIQNKAEELKRSFNGININQLNFNVDYETLQLSNPWFDIINLVIPVISSTFASFSRMCANMGVKTIGHLFVDEAGQALPQASVGAIFRSMNVMVVGDPSQIKPVLTLDSRILNMLGEYYNVGKKYLSENASTQTLVDEISKYGFYKDDRREKWIGIPLWVHRRCQYPMFDIANTISYGGNMVQGVKENGVSEWFDVSGSAIDKYVAATRAKKEFYIIGSKKLYLGLKSDVINNTFEIISNYNDCC